MDFVYRWADGMHVNVRLDDQKLCLLVMIGVRADGREELVALTDGYREAAESSADLLVRDCRRRGMRASVLAAETGRWDSGARCARCSRRPASSVAGSTRYRMLLPALPKSRARGRRSARKDLSAAQRSEGAAHPRERGQTVRGDLSMVRSFRRRSPRSATTSSSCWRSTTSRPSTGFI